MDILKPKFTRKNEIRARILKIKDLSRERIDVERSASITTYNKSTAKITKTKTKYKYTKIICNYNVLFA